MARRTFRYNSTVKMPPPSLTPERAKVAEFYSAGSGTIPPLPWQTFPPPFSPRVRRQDHLDVCAWDEHPRDRRPFARALWHRRLARPAHRGHRRGAGGGLGLASPPAGGDLSAGFL